MKINITLFAGVYPRQTLNHCKINFKRSMKISTLAYVFGIIILTTACTDDILHQGNPGSLATASYSASHYAAFHCKLENNVDGAECKISSQEMCTQEFPCMVPEDPEGVSNFTNTLYKNFTEEEIQNMLGQPITDSALIVALKLDGFPIQ